MWREGIDDPLERWEFVDVEMEEMYLERHGLNTMNCGLIKQRQMV